jgi:hypothetical protein
MFVRDIYQLHTKSASARQRVKAQDHPHGGLAGAVWAEEAVSMPGRMEKERSLTAIVEP